MKISLIAAMASNRVIGVDGRMPWHLPADLKLFRRITWGAPVIMGRKTFEAIGAPLPGRRNIIVSRNPLYQVANCQLATDLNSAFADCLQAAEVFVIGGAELYENSLPLANYIYLTEIHKEFCGDTFFPELPQNQWREIKREHIIDDPNADFSYSFLQFERI